VAKSMEELLAKRPVDRAAVNAHKKRMVDEVRATGFGSFARPLS
jgi:hypothetical protein